MELKHQKPKIMNIPSKILVEAIDYAKSHPKVEPWFDRRDRSNEATVKSIRSEIIDVSIKHKALLIRIFVDYIAKNQDTRNIEDIVIDLVWSAADGYKIKDIRAVPEV